MDNLKISPSSFKKVDNVLQLYIPKIREVEVEMLTNECRLLEIDGCFGNSHYCSITISGYNNLRKIRVKEDAMNSVLKLFINHNANLKSISVRRNSCCNVRQLEITGSD